MTGSVRSDTEGPTTLPPLALYVHIPWCRRKCPYCDFNSYPWHGQLPEAAYVERLLWDLAQEVTVLTSPRPLVSLFIGGGTPSLLSGRAITELLRGVRDRIELPSDAEITLEVNPGTADAERITAYRQAGVDRLSIGAQSFSTRQLKRIARIHGPEDIRTTVDQARQAGFENLNLDLMYGLPEQSLTQAYRDLEQALALGPEHISYYPLTLESGTAFHRAPPPLPDQDLIADMQQQGIVLLASQGFEPYEVSAYAAVGYRCRHNLNYWQFGDYIGIGAGAHGKLTDPIRQRVERRWKRHNPAAYLDPANRDRLVGGQQTLSPADLILEFALNALRLPQGFEASLFEHHTGLPFTRIADRVDAARAAGLLVSEPGPRVRSTELGRGFLNDLLGYFVPS